MIGDRIVAALDMPAIYAACDCVRRLQEEGRGMTLADIPVKCTECEVDLICNVPAGDGITRGGGGSSYDVECPNCGQWMKLVLPGEPTDVWVTMLPGR